MEFVRALPTSASSILFNIQLGFLTDYFCQGSFIHKCTQLWETIMVRHGLMVVGTGLGIEVFELNWRHVESAGTEVWMSPARPRPLRSLRFYGISLSRKILEGFGGVPKCSRLVPTSNISVSCFFMFLQIASRFSWPKRKHQKTIVLVETCWDVESEVDQGLGWSLNLLTAHQVENVLSAALAAVADGCSVEYVEFLSHDSIHSRAATKRCCILMSNSMQQYCNNWKAKICQSPPRSEYVDAAATRKTLCWGDLYLPVQIHKINPKCNT